MAPLSYDFTAKTLHWTMALLIAVLLAIGLVMVDLPKGDLRSELHDIHKQIGVVVLILAVLRFAYRLNKGTPILPDSMGQLEKIAAQAGHLGLYGLMFLLPVSGILQSQFGDHPIHLFGLKLPTLVGPDKDLKELWEDCHEILADGIMALIAVHIAAALRHHFILKDNVLSRMLPSGLTRKTAAPTTDAKS